MGCPDQVVLSEDLTFTVSSRDANGEPVDADGLPTYKIYEDESGTAMSGFPGTMAKLDDANTTGFYSEQIEVTAANGFERYKSYTIRIVSQIAGFNVAKNYTFQAVGAEDVAGTTGSGSGTKDLDYLLGLAKYHGWNDWTTNGEAAAIRFINNTLELLATLAPWPFYQKRDGRITLATDDEDQVCTNDGDTAIDNITHMGNLIRAGRMSPLDPIPTIDEWLRKKSVSSSTGPPTEYALRKYVYLGSTRIEVLWYPKPTSAENGDYVYFCYWQMPAIMASGSDQTDWPDHLMWLLEEALEQRLASKNRDRLGVALESPDFMRKVYKAMSHSRSSYVPIRAEPPIDDRTKSIREIPMQVSS